MFKLLAFASAVVVAAAPVHAAQVLDQQNIIVSQSYGAGSSEGSFR